MRVLVWVLVALLGAAPAFAGALDDARELIDDGKLGDARELLERTAQDPALRGESLVLLTRACNAQEDYENGVRYGKEAVSLLPDSSEAHFRYAEAMRIKMSKVSKVKAMLSLSSYKKELARAIELDPRNLNARGEQIGFLTQAPGFAGGDLAEARTRTAELIELDWRRGMLMRAQIEFKDKDDEAGVATLREVLAKYPDEAGARWQLATWLQSHERYEDAEREFLILAESEHPRLALNARYQRARTRILGEYDQETAIRQLREYIADLPEDRRGLAPEYAAWRRIGNAYAQLGQIEPARQAYQTSLALEDDEDTRKDLKALPR